MLYSNCLPGILWLLLFCGSSSWSRGLVCIVIVIFPGHTLFYHMTLNVTVFKNRPFKDLTHFIAK